MVDSKIVVYDTQNKGYPCPICDKIFKTAETLRGHFESCYLKHEAQLSASDILNKENISSNILPSTPGRSDAVTVLPMTSPQTDRTIPPGSEFAQDLPSEPDEPQKTFEARIPTVADVNNPTFFQTKIMADKYPHLAIHRPTGFLFCSEHGMLCEWKRMILHYQVKHHHCLPVEFKREIEMAIMDLLIPPGGALGFFQSMRDTSPIIGVAVEDGYECVVKDCNRAFCSKKVMTRHYVNDHKNAKLKLVRCSIQRVWWPVSQGSIKLYRVPLVPRRNNQDSTPRPSLPGLKTFIHSFTPR